MDETIKSMERIGGTFTHLENELFENLKQFHSVPVSEDQKEVFAFTKNLILIFTFGVIQEVSQFVKLIEKIYVNSRLLEDLTPLGKSRIGNTYMNEIFMATKRLPQYQIMFQSNSNRIQIHKFSLWLIRLVNYVDENYNDVVHIMPESFIEIPFEIFRAFKRGNIPLYETESEIVSGGVYADEYN